MPVFCITLKMNVLDNLRMRQGSKIPVSSERLLIVMEPFVLKGLFEGRPAVPYPAIMSLYKDCGRKCTDFCFYKTNKKNASCFFKMA